MPKNFYSIRTYIILLTILVVLTPSIILTLIFYKNSRNEIKAVTNAKMLTEIRSVSYSVDVLLKRGEKVNNYLQSLIDTETIDLSDQKKFYTTLLLELQNRPDIMSIEYGNENNESISVARDIMGLDYGVGISGKSTNNSFVLYGVDDQYNLKEKSWELPNYDSRVMPWYIQGKDLAKPQWTSVYLWPNNEFGIDIISATDNGKVKGVADVSVRLSEISRIIKNLELFPNTKFLIFEKDGSFIGANDNDSTMITTDNLERLKISDSKDITIREINSYLISKYGSLDNIKLNQLESIVLGGKNYYLLNAAYNNPAGIDWIISVAVSENDVSAEINSSIFTVFIVASVLLVISLSLAVYFANYITKPLSKLVEFSKSFANGDININLDINRKDETGVLAKSFIDMTTKINQNLAKIINLKNQDDAILNSIGDAVFACDREYKIVLFNRVAEIMTGIDRSDAIGQHFSKVVKFVNEKTGLESYDFIKQAVEEDKISRMKNHTLLIRKDGGSIPVADSAAPVKDKNGEIIGCVTVFHDVTKERAIDKAKTEFVSIASHQLRTPLTALNWLGESLNSDMGSKLDKKQREYVQQIISSTERMTNLVNALLNVSRLEMGTLLIDIKIINIRDEVERCLKEQRNNLLKRKLKLITNFDNNIQTSNMDADLLHIVLENILSNSIKYSFEGSELLLNVKNDKTKLVISLTDKGIGIPKGDQDKIFSKMYRSDNAKLLDPDGSGLGLYICKEILDYTGGSIWLESTEGEGSTFYISWPINGMNKTNIINN